MKGDGNDQNVSTKPKKKNKKRGKGRDKDKAHVPVPTLAAVAGKSNEGPAESPALEATPEQTVRGQVKEAARKLEKSLRFVTEFHLSALQLTEYQTDREGGAKGHEKERKAELKGNER